MNIVSAKSKKEYQNIVNSKFTGEVQVFTNHLGQSGEFWVYITIDQYHRPLEEGARVILKDGIIHNDKGPAIIEETSWATWECYIENGKFRKNYPSSVTIHKDANLREEFFYNEKGVVHREDGPAVISHSNSNTDDYEKILVYFLDGKEYKECEYNAITEKKKLKEKIDKL